MRTARTSRRAFGTRRHPSAGPLPPHLSSGRFVQSRPALRRSRDTATKRFVPQAHMLEVAVPRGARGGTRLLFPGESLGVWGMGGWVGGWELIDETAERETVNRAERMRCPNNLPNNLPTLLPVTELFVTWRSRAAAEPNPRTDIVRRRHRNSTSAPDCTGRGKTPRTAVRLRHGMRQGTA